jgi:hypothetical protein
MSAADDLAALRRKQAERTAQHAEQTKQRAAIKALKKRIALLRSRIDAANDPWIRKLEESLTAKTQRKRSK